MEKEVVLPPVALCATGDFVFKIKISRVVATTGKGVRERQGVAKSVAIDAIPFM